MVGWVRMGGSPIDYPVVAAHLDGGYYLNHNFSGDESLHGAVSLTFGCRQRMGGRNTVLLAHTMLDWSMFRAVRALCDQGYLDVHPTVDLMAQDGKRWRGRWFAAARYSSTDPWVERTHFQDDEEFAAWLEKVLAQNWLVTDGHPDVNARVLTCCTCAMTAGPHDRRAAFAVLEEA